MVYTSFMNFIIFNLADGTQKPCDLANLSQSLSLNCEIVRMVGDKHEAIGYVSPKTLVHFAVESANYALQNYSKKILPEAQTCIDLINKWLEDSSSVSKEELYAAYDAANAAADAAYAADAVDAADDAANAANAAVNAANAAVNAAADAAYDAGNAAYAAYYAADAAANAAYYAADAAYAAADAAGKSRLNEQNRQGNFILKFFEVE